MLNRIFTAIVAIVGLSCLVFAEHPKTTEYQLNFDYISRCHLGDIDLISLELDREQDERKRMIMTVESLDSKQVYAHTEILKNTYQSFDNSSNYEIFKNNLALNLPQVKQPELVAIYVCKDSEEVNKCGNKLVEDLRELEKFYEIPAENVDPSTGEILDLSKVYKKNVEVKDRVYYFRPAVLTEDGLKVVPEANTSTKYKELANLYGGQNSYFYGNKMIANSKKIRSLSMKLDEDALSLQMPYMDMDHCFQQ